MSLDLRSILTLLLLLLEALLAQKLLHANGGVLREFIPRRGAVVVTCAGMGIRNRSCLVWAPVRAMSMGYQWLQLQHKGLWNLKHK